MPIYDFKCEQCGDKTVSIDLGPDMGLREIVEIDLPEEEIGFVAWLWE